MMDESGQDFWHYFILPVTRLLKCGGIVVAQRYRCFVVFDLVQFEIWKEGDIKHNCIVRYFIA